MISELGKILKKNKNIEFWYLLVWCKFYYNLPDEALMEVIIIVIPVLIFHIYLQLKQLKQENLWKLKLN